MQNLTPEAQELIKAVQENYQQKLLWQNEEKIHSRETISFFAFAYEKLRNVVDYHEDHLLRKRALQRMLRRRLVFSQGTDEIAQSLISELVRSRYFSNNFIPQSKISVISAVITKYLVFIKNLPQFRDVFIGLCAREIEDNLSLNNELNLLLFCQRVFAKKILVKDEAMLFVAVEETLLRNDETTICFHLLKMTIPDWDHLTSERITEVCRKFTSLYQIINDYFSSPEKERLVRFLRHKIAPFVILQDLIAQNDTNLEQIITDPEVFEKTIVRVSQNRYHKASIALQTAAIQSFIYIFLTKMLFAFLIEVPYDLYVLGRLKMLPLIVNLLFPPFFMIITTQSVQKPGATNTQKIIKELKNAAYEQPGFSLPAINLDLLSPMRSFLNMTFSVLYLLTFLLVFGGTVQLLRLLQFNIVSLAVFFFFVSTVAFFAFRIRRNFGNLKITEEKEGLVSGLFNFISFPFIRLGVIFSKAISRFNIFVFILDVLIEAPLKMLFELIEEWFAFIRQKQEEIL